MSEMTKTRPSVNGNPSQPVTQEHFDDAMRAIKQTFDQIEEKMATKEQLASVKTEVTSVKTEVTSVKKMQERTLQIIESVDGRLKEWKDIPERMADVETDVFKLKVKANRRD